MSITRKEIFLAKMTGADVSIPDPLTREEFYLSKLCGEDVTVPLPVTLDEIYLYALCGGDVTPPKAVTRLQMFMAKALGVDVPDIVPVTREEWYWDDYELSGLPVGYRRIDSMTMNDNCYYLIEGFKLTGDDTLRFSFSVTAACNVIGAYSGSASGNNYSLYVAIGATSSSNYLRYKDGAYNSAIDANTRYDVEITPTGSHGIKTESTWTPKTFTATTDLCIGTTKTDASSAKLKGQLFGNIDVVGRAKFIPCVRVSDSVVGWYETYTGKFYEPIGTNPTAGEYV